MSRPGVHYKDLHPPDDDEPQSATMQHSVTRPSETKPAAPKGSDILGHQPTTSHKLAAADHDEKGAAQTSEAANVTDLGWHEDDSKIPKPLVGGMHNEELWLLIRRFNKVMSTSHRCEGGREIAPN